MYNITEHVKKRLINKYGGSERKDTVILDDGNTYLIKLPDKTREVKKGISYVNNAVSEYLGCKIIKSIGLNVQDVKLGIYKAKSGKGEIKEYIACACRDFIPAGYSLAEAEITSLNSEDSKSAKDASFAVMYKISENVGEISEDVTKDELITFYCDQFIADALIGNPDRHNGNWGFITGAEYNKIAPIYDCGSSLCPMLEDHELTSSTAKNMAVNAVSAIRGENGDRLHYKEYISSGKNVDVTKALKRLLPNINLQEIFTIIDEIPCITEERKMFYKEYETCAYENILLQALYQIQKREVTPVMNENNAILYEFYRKNIKEIKKFPLFQTKDVYISRKKMEVMKASNRFALVIKDGEAAGIIPIRSNSGEVREAVDIISYLTKIEHSNLLENGIQEKEVSVNDRLDALEADRKLASVITKENIVK